METTTNFKLRNIPQSTIDFKINSMPNNLQNLIEEIKKRVFTCYASNEDAEIGFNEVKKIIQKFYEAGRAEERERVIAQLDWKKRTDGVEFYDGDDVVDWIINKLSTLSSESEGGEK